MKKNPYENREEIYIPQGVNMIFVKGAYKKVLPCSTCSSKPKILIQNLALKKSVARKFSYELKCDCGKRVVGTEPYKTVDVWNSKHAHSSAQIKEAQTFASEDETAQYFAQRKGD